MFKLQIIVGSTREGRSAEPLVPWVVDRAKAHGAFDVELLDLRQWPLPLFQETMATVGDIANPTYSQPLVKKWNQTIASGDAFLLITPEYNHSTSGVLKNAIDNVFLSFGFRHKPMGFVGYSMGIGAGARAVEHLAQIAFELEAHALRDTVLFPYVAQAFKDGAPTAPATEASLKITLDDLAWWAEVLKAARAKQLRPGNARLRAALAAKPT
jgi:NAD(P)H-dependent FMN reductase